MITNKFSLELGAKENFREAHAKILRASKGSDIIPWLQAVDYLHKSVSCSLVFALGEHAYRKGGPLAFIGYGRHFQLKWPDLLERAEKGTPAFRIDLKDCTETLNYLNFVRNDFCHPKPFGLKQEYREQVSILMNFAYVMMLGVFDMEDDSDLHDLAVEMNDSIGRFDRDYPIIIFSKFAFYVQNMGSMLTGLSLYAKEMGEKLKAAQAHSTKAKSR